MKSVANKILTLLGVGNSIKGFYERAPIVAPSESPPYPTATFGAFTTFPAEIHLVQTRTFRRRPFSSTILKV